MTSRSFLLLLALGFVASSCRDLVLPGPPPTTAFLSGRVVAAVPGSSASAAVPNAVVTLLNSNVHATTDERGVFTLGPLPAGTYKVFFSSKANGTTRQRILTNVVVKPGATNNLGDVSIQENALLTGRALIMGKASGNIGITVFAPGTDYVTTTADTGGWLLSNLPEGQIRATAWRPGFSPATTTDINLEGGVVTSAVDLILEPESASAPPGSITGSVLVVGHEDNGGVTVKAISATSQETRASATTAADGTFVLPGLSSDLYFVTLELAGYPSARVPNLAVGGGVNLELDPVVMAPEGQGNVRSNEPIGGPSGPLYSLDGGQTSDDGGQVMSDDGGVIGAECTLDNDCASGRLCIERRCVGCSVNVQCRPGYTCQAGDCVRNCGSNAECPNGLVCLSGSCTGCITSSDCQDSTLVCNASSRCAHCQSRAECPAGKACLPGGCGTCSTDGDCGAGALCEQGVCTAGNCHGNADCAANEACLSRTCSQCTADSQCRAGQLCINQACVTGNCRSVIDCAPGQVCLGNQCGACANDGDCGSGKLCLAGPSGLRCTPGTCRFDADCTGSSAGMLCVSNTCQPCGSANPCPSGKICNATGRCVIGDCFSNFDCTGSKAGWACLGGNCTPCATNTDCAASGYVCQGGQCKVGNCITATDCPVAGQLCTNNACVGCTSTSQCPANQVCDTDQLCHPGNCITTSNCTPDKVCLSHLCSPCTTDAQCGAGKLCLGGACVTGNCRVAGDCPTAGQLCLNNTCSNCTATPQCGSGQVCDLDQLCHPGNCVSASDCTGGRLCLSRSCTQCTADTQCTAGKICVNGGCVTGVCHNDSECSGGQQICDVNATWTCRACSPLNQTTATTCGTGRVCDSSGFCHFGNCVSNGNCGGGTACVNFNCGPCSADNQCNSGQLCIGALCKTGNCHGTGADPNIDCAATNGVCNASNVCVGNCRSNADCSATTGYCDTSTHFCAACTGAGQCGSGRVCTPGGGGNTCVTAQCSTLESTCAPGYSCVSGSCVQFGPDFTADGGGYLEGASFTASNATAMALSGNNSLYFSTFEPSSPTGAGTYSVALEPNLTLRWRVRDSISGNQKTSFAGAGIVLPAPGFPNGELFLTNDGNGGAIAHRSDNGAQVWRINMITPAFATGLVNGVPYVAWENGALSATLYWMKTDGTGQRSVVLTGCTAPEAIAFGTKAIYFVCGEQLYVVDPVTAAWKTVPHGGAAAIYIGGNYPSAITPVWRPPDNYVARGVNSGTVSSDVLVYMGRASFDWMFAVNIPDDWLTNGTSTTTWTLWSNSTTRHANTPLTIDGSGAVYVNNGSNLYKVNLFTGLTIATTPMGSYSPNFNLAANQQVIDVTSSGQLQGYQLTDGASTTPTALWSLPATPGTFLGLPPTFQATQTNRDNLLVFQNNALGQPVLKALAPGNGATTFVPPVPAWPIGGDSGNRQSVQGTQCTTNTQCAATQTCILGKCVGQCRDASQCVAGQGCTLMQCGNCAAPSGCRGGEVCWSAQCIACGGPGCCSTAADCSNGNYCGNGGQCKVTPATGTPGAFSQPSLMSKAPVNVSVATDGTMYLGDTNGTNQPFWKVVSPAGTVLSTTPTIPTPVGSAGQLPLLMITGTPSQTLWWGGQGQSLYSAPASSSVSAWTVSTYNVFGSNFLRLAQGVSSVIGPNRTTIYATTATGVSTTMLIALDATLASAGGAGNPGLLWAANLGATCNPSGTSVEHDHLLIGSDGTIYTVCPDGSVEAWAADGDPATGPAPNRLGLMKWRSAPPATWGGVTMTGRPAIGKAASGDVLYLPRVQGAQIGVAILNLPTTTNGTVPLEVPVDATIAILTDQAGRAITLGCANTCATRELAILSPTGQVLFDDKTTWWPSGHAQVLTADGQLFFSDYNPSGTGVPRDLKSVSVANPNFATTLYALIGPGNLATDANTAAVVLSTGQVATGLVAFDHQPISGSARSFSGMPFAGTQGPMPNAWSARNADQQRRNSLKTQ